MSSYLGDLICHVPLFYSNNIITRILIVSLGIEVPLTFNKMSPEPIIRHIRQYRRKENYKYWG